MEDDKILNSNKFDNAIIQEQLYNINKENDLFKNNNWNNKFNKSNKLVVDDNYDEDDDINLNININNYLSKKNINNNSSVNNKKLLKKNNTAKNKGYVLQNKNKNLNNFNRKYEQSDIMKEKLLARIRQQKGGVKHHNDKFNINKNIEKKVNPKIILSKKNEKEENGKNPKKEKEESKGVPKILTFLRTFKNFALPLKSNNTKKENEKKNKNNNAIINNINQENENNYLVNPYKSCYNFGSKLKPKVGKLNLNKRNLELNTQRFINEQNEIGDGNEGDEYIDYNRFTFRNNGEEENSPFKNFKKTKNENNYNSMVYNISKNQNNNDNYNDNDINQIINIDEYNRKKNLYNNINNEKNNIGNDYIQNYKSLKLEQFSPDFKKGMNSKKNKNEKNNNPYLRKKYLKNKYNSPKPQHKNKTKNNSINTYFNKYKDSMNIKVQTFDNYNNKNEDSFQSLKLGKGYRKPILNTSFQLNNNINKSNSNYYNNISVDQINMSNNYNTTNRPLKNNKYNEILVDMNDSLDSINEPNYYTNDNLYSNRSPMYKKSYNTNSKVYYSKKIPLNAKQNGGSYYYSENYDTSQLDEEDEYIKKNNNYARFMEPFQRNENNNWYNEDSYLSFDIVNMNEAAKNKKLLYRKPIKAVNDKNMNKNNSMYIKRVVHYDNKDYSYFNDSDYSSSNDNKYKNRLDYIDYDEKEKNVFDFDAPRAIKDSMDEVNNNNDSDFIYDSSRENQTSINSDINSNKFNSSQTNNSQRSGNNSKVYIKKNSKCISNRDNKKGVYMKKLNTVFNFYQGTKKFFSKINDKVFGNNKNNDNKTNINVNKNTTDKIIKKNELLIYPGIATPRMKEENEDNNSSLFTKNSLGTPIPNDKNQKIIKVNKPIKIKVLNNKKAFKTKLYNFYLQKIDGKKNGYYFFSKIQSYNSYKIPKLPIYYMTREIIKVYKIPVNKDKCYFQKITLINKAENKIFEHQTICSFFSLGGNFKNDDENVNNNQINDNVKTEGNKKLINLKKNILNKDEQTNSLLLNELNNIQNSNNFDKNSFSFKNNYMINSKNSDIKENFKINNFSFSLPKKEDKIKFENKKIIPEKNNNLSFINNKENKKYEYDYILSFKNNQFSENNDLLSQKVINHFEDLRKETDYLSFHFEPNQIEKENNFKKKFKNGEIEKIIKKYLTPNKKEEMTKTANNNCFTENKNEKMDINEQGNSERKLKMEWTKKDFSKEIEQAEKYIQELKMKMGENPKKSDIICLLNMLTVDNLKTILNKIIDSIIKNGEEFLIEKDIIDNEYILIKIIVDKATIEKRFVNLYAKLCYEVNLKLNDKMYNNINFKKILIEECKVQFNLLNKINLNIENDINTDDQEMYIIKKKFLGNIDFICELINVGILNPDIGLFYLDVLFKKYNSLNENDKFKKDLVLEAIVNFLSKFGKKIYEIKDINCEKYLSYFIENLNYILNNEDLQGFLKYKIINLIEKQKNNWKDSLYEKSILVKGKQKLKKHNTSTSLSKNNKLRKRKHSSKNNTLNSKNPDLIAIAKNNIIEDNRFNSNKNNQNRNTINYISSLNINTNYNNEEIIKLIEKDLETYEVFIKQNNIKNKSDLDKNKQIGNEYDWSMIENILSKNNNDLGELIRCYIEVCIDQINNKSIIFIANDYIKNIIGYYSDNITNKEKDIIHNKMITLFRNIQDICIDNDNMKEIMGYLLFILIENKLFFIKDFNNFIGGEQDIIIVIAEVIKYAIISSESKCKKYHNDFKQTKLFVDNSIFNNYVTNEIQDSLN